MIVPAFAVERTQKFVFLVKHLMESGQIQRLPVFCDSPMAIKAVEIFLKHDEEYSDDTRDMIRKYGTPLQWPGFTFASTPEESKRINAALMPSIIISSSGMVTGGRILHHLAQRLPDPRNLVLFIVFQAPGTRGFLIKNKAPEVKIFAISSQYVPRSPPSSSSAIMLIRRNCCSGCAHFPASPRRRIWSTGSPMLQANCAI